MNGKRWTEPELDKLEQLAGDLPMAQTIAKYNRWAKANGFPQRSISAVARAGHKRHLSFRPFGAMVSRQALCTYLGLTAGQGHLLLDIAKCHQLQPGGRRYVARIELRRLARRHPEWFAGAPLANLVQLLEDEKLAEWVKEHQPRRHLNRSPVRCIETGMVYPSVTAAAGAVFVERAWIHRAIRHGHTAAGFHWEYIHGNPERLPNRNAGGSRHDHAV